MVENFAPNVGNLVAEQWYDLACSKDWDNFFTKMPVLVLCSVILCFNPVFIVFIATHHCNLANSDYLLPLRLSRVDKIMNF